MPTVDFAIITGLVEEFQELRRLFPRLQEDDTDQRHGQWFRGRIQGANGVNYEIVASYQTKKGPLEANSLTTKLVEVWDPAYIILVGIAGTFDKDVKLGDVVVSQQIFYYDPGKAVAGKIRYRPEGYPCSVTLIRQSEALFLDRRIYRKWQQSGSRSARKKATALAGKFAAEGQKALNKHVPKVHFGTVASGSLVVASKKLQEKLLRLHGQIIATEMEGAGVLNASFSMREVPVPAIVIKGISDAADEQKENEDEKGYWRELAKENSVRFALSLIERGRIRPLHTDEFDLDLTRGSAGDFRSKIPDPASGGISGLAFPKLVVPKGPLTHLLLRLQVFGEHEGTQSQLDVIKGVVEYTRLDGNRSQTTWEGACIPALPFLAAEPVKLYLMIRGTTGRIAVSASSGSTQHSTEWRAQ